MRKIKIGVFDDHPIVVKALVDVLVLDKRFELVFTADEKSDFFNKALFLEVDVLIIDILASEVLGLELFEEITKKHPNIKCIAYSSLNSVMLVENLLFIGVKGFVNKKQPIEEMIEAISTVNDGDVYLSKEFHFLTSKYREVHNTILTSREIEILQLIANENTSQDIAEKLSLSIHTIENHRKNIFKKLEVKNLAGMIMVASRLGYIS